MTNIQIKTNNTISYEQLTKLISYDSSTGVLTWKKSGKIAGCWHPTGYLYVTVNQQAYRAHRLIWFIMTKKWPKDVVDHIDGDSSNNRFWNLREATLSQNQHNRRMSKNNTSGVKGLTWNKPMKKWMARVKVDGVSVHVGYFNSKTKAKKALMEVRLRLHGDFGRN